MKLGILFVLAARVGEASADSKNITLTTDRPVYKAGAPGVVKMTIANNTPKEILTAKFAPWGILQGDKAVHFPFPTKKMSVIPSKGSLTYTWDKKRWGSFVSPGSYMVRVGLLIGNDQPLWLSRTIALTPDGTLAGKTFFPLAAGNQWVYRHKESTFETMTVTGSGGGGWWKVKNFLGGAERILSLIGTPFPTLKMKGNGGVISNLYPFKRPKGYSDEIGFEKDKVTVGAVSETVTTPAGKFTDCYRLDISPMTYPAYDRLWFAPGVGLVQYSYTPADPDAPSKVYSLYRTQLNNGGKVYTIGLLD